MRRMDAFTIVGAGGIGCAVGYALRVAGASVVFIEANADKVCWGREHGVSVDGLSPQVAEFQHFDEWLPQPHDTVLLCTKCFCNAGVLARLPDSVTLIPIQNGFDRSLDRRLSAEGIASFVSECE